MFYCFFSIVKAIFITIIVSFFVSLVIFRRYQRRKAEAATQNNAESNPQQ